MYDVFYLVKKNHIITRLTLSKLYLSGGAWKHQSYFKINLTRFLSFS